MIISSVALFGAAVIAAAPAPAASARRVAVLDFNARWAAGCAAAKTDAEQERCEILRLFADQARAGALAVLRPPGFVVMTRENSAQILKDMGGVCSEGECEVETARLLGASVVVSGDVSSLEGTYIVSLKVHDVASAALLASGKTKAKTKLDAFENVQAETERMLREAVAVGAEIPAATPPARPVPPQPRKQEAKVELAASAPPPVPEARSAATTSAPKPPGATAAAPQESTSRAGWGIGARLGGVLPGGNIGGDHSDLSQAVGPGAAIGVDVLWRLPRGFQAGPYVEFWTMAGGEMDALQGFCSDKDGTPGRCTGIFQRIGGQVRWAPWEQLRFRPWFGAAGGFEQIDVHSASGDNQHWSGFAVSLSGGLDVPSRSFGWGPYASLGTGTFNAGSITPAPRKSHQAAQLGLRVFWGL